MLKRIHIKNFRSCKDVVLDDLGSMTALVGWNGSGKTNILKAIERLAKVASSTDALISFGREVVAVPGHLTADVECEATLYRYSVGVRGVGGAWTPSSIRDHLTLQEFLAIQNSLGKWETLVERDRGEIQLAGRAKPVKIGPMAPCLPALVALLPQDDTILKPIGSILGFLTRVRYYPVDEPNEVVGGEAADRIGLIPSDLYQRWLSEYQLTGHAGQSVVIRILHAFYEQKARFDELSSLLGPDGLGLLEEIRVGTAHDPFGLTRKEADSEDQRLYFVAFRPGKQLGGSRQSLSFGNLSLGTRRVIHLLTALILDDSGLKLIEHPEDGIHRGLVRKLISLLRTNADPAQIILTSHSAVVMNALEAEDIRLVYTQNGSTKVRALTSKEIRAASGYIEEDGTLAEFLETVEG